MPPEDYLLDLARGERIGLAEAVYCRSKSSEQIAAAIAHAAAEGLRLLLTRLEPDKEALLPSEARAALAYDPVSRTGSVGPAPQPDGEARVAIVSAGTSDAPVAREAARTLAFHGQASTAFSDVGVAGLWRLLERRPAIGAHPVVIAVAGMEGALFSVLGGLIGSVLIAVPTSTGYGVTAGGNAALHSALGSCAPGVVSVNIDNGYGAACAALRILNRGFAAGG
jgi:NCAIR mutase (PurE)-related protein